MLRFTGGSADDSNYKLIPETDEVEVTFLKVERYPQNPDRLKFVFRIDDYDEDEADEGFAEFLGKEHWESANVPNKPLNANHRLHAIVSGLIGHTLKDGEDVDVNEYLGNKYRADFKHVDAKAANGDGSFSTKRDEQGNVVKKAQIGRLKPIKKSKTRNVFQEAEDAA